MHSAIDNLGPEHLQTDLWQSTYSLAGEAYVHAIVEWLARHLRAQRVMVARAIDLPVTRVRVVASTQRHAPDSFALAGTPCELVYRGQRLVQTSGLGQTFPQLCDTGSDSFHGYPFLDDQGQCYGHLAMFFADSTTLPDWFDTLLEPITARLGAELLHMEQQTRLEAAERQLALHNRVLRLTTQHTPLKQVLDTLLNGIEIDHPGTLCSIMALDRTGRFLRLLSAPSLPAAYLAAIDGVEIGPEIGSCGAAAYRRQRVIVNDTLQHPYWAASRELALRFELHSCWSQPILSGDRVLGVFAIYHHLPSVAGANDFAMIEHVSDLVCQVLLHHETMEALRLKSEHYQMLLRHGADGTVVLDREGRFLEISEGFLKQICAEGPEAIMATRIWDWSANLEPSDILKILQSHHDQPLIFQTAMRHVDGSLWDAEITATAVEIDGQSLIWASARDITERKKLEAALLREARLDSLTGVANRGNFLQALQKEVTRARRYPQPLSVLMLDLDHFKNVNDQYGHSTGDDVLRTLCRESAPLLRKEDLMGRLGGEEFAIMLPHTGVEEAAEAARRLLARILDMSVQVPEVHDRIHFSCSIGVASLAPEDADGERLLARADKALYQAKAAGRGCVKVL
ncbi:sensor domain-containing diguanylate cyclase [Paludibacterium purpuratum]|uniref:diguanylate cyclase n=1 Tax=Paludibacterium purpuratum TaxID=1144873 RepID=A0A4R7B7F4_9NEIS|nr:diguanylate cyclase [Paludibacterium purpuratum]TDR80694.1 PAS domain S-box-containing protein/diguanylate cyclase (GGDEF)-like protein [Paludibacterium purpuratum]